MSESKLPPVPLTLEGSCVLHQMFRIKRPGDSQAVERVSTLLSAMQNNTALFSMMGHKADLMLLHFRSTFDELNKVEVDLRSAGLGEFTEPTTSYVSVVELGLYESTGKAYAELEKQGIEPYSEAWNTAMAEITERQKKAMSARLYPEIPDAKFICFYPMDRRRGEAKNWYSVPMAERASMMHVHGLNGRRYAGRVKQIISGSIGFDDWEWGVDLFANDPLDFKRLVYEMRFDEVSAVYALFGPFYFGVRHDIGDLTKLVNGG